MKSLQKKALRTAKKSNQEKTLQQRVYSATAIEHTAFKSGVRDGGLGNAQKTAILRMLQNEKE